MIVKLVDRKIADTEGLCKVCNFFTWIPIPFRADIGLLSR